MCVSIPHREATNASPRVIGIWRRLFQSLIGKLQTFGIVWTGVWTTQVSIPHREATNGIIEVQSRNGGRFQSLIGKLQTELVSVIGHQGTAFQSLIGKLQTIDTEVSMVGEENARFNPS